MSQHATVETLSRYVDQELPAAELRAVEDHLEECVDCRARLTGLRSVVDVLHRLERQQPPSAFGGDFYRRLAHDRKTPRLRRAMERLLERNAVHSSLLIGFSVIIALAAIGYMLSDALETRGERGGETRVILVPPAGGADARHDGEVEELGGREFVLREGSWWSSGLDPSRAIDLRVDPSTEEGAGSLDDWLADWPELSDREDLTGLGGPIVFEDASGRLVELLFGDGDGGD